MLPRQLLAATNKNDGQDLLHAVSHVGKGQNAGSRHGKCHHVEVVRDGGNLINRMQCSCLSSVLSWIRICHLEQLISLAAPVVVQNHDHPDIIC